MNQCLICLFEINEWQSCCLWQGFILIKVKKQSLSQVVHPLIRPCDTCSSSCSAYFCLLNSFSVPSRSSLSLCASCLAVTISFRITRSRLTFSSATVLCSSCAICSLNINTLSISKWTAMDLLLNQPVNVVSLSHQQVARCRNKRGTGSTIHYHTSSFSWQLNKMWLVHCGNSVVKLPYSFTWKYHLSAIHGKTV